MSENNKESTPVQLAEIISRLFTNCQEKEARHVAKYGISIVEFRCIRILYEHKKLTVNKLAQQMSLTTSRITRIIDNLVKKHFVYREGGQIDRRIYNLFLTSRGKRLAGEMIQNYTKMHEEILNNISSEYKQPMIEILMQLNNAVEKWLRME